MEDSKRKQVAEILAEEAQRLHKELTATQAMIEFINKQTKSLESLSEPYNPTSTYPDKILYILKQRGESFTKELVEFISGKEPELSYKGLSLNIGKAASRLVKDKKIKLTKVGNSNKYSLV